MSEPIRFTLDGSEVEAHEGETIWQVAHRLGTDLPHLCYAHEPGYRADGNCRACMVEVEGERVLAASCQRRAGPGLVVHTATERAAASRRMVMELLVADQPPRAAAHEHDSKLWQWAERLEVGASRFPARPAPAPDPSHPAMRVNLDACIHCNLCVRACREVQVNDVIGMAYRGIGSKIVFDFDDAMGASTCVACGECVQACPTGALMEAALVDEAGVDRRLALDEVASVCPYCGVGCQIGYQVKDNEIVAVQGRDGPANHKRLCVKGRFGFDYVAHPHRLTTPLVRREDAPRRPTARSIRPIPSPISGLRAGRRLSTAPRAGSPPSATATAGRRWPASAPPRARTRRRTSCRRWSARASGPTTWTTARGCAMRPRWRRCSKASAPAR